MLAVLPYKPWLDGLSEERQSAKKKVFEYFISIKDKIDEVSNL